MRRGYIHTYNSTVNARKATRKLASIGARLHGRRRVSRSGPMPEIREREIEARVGSRVSSSPQSSPMTERRIRIVHASNVRGTTKICVSIKRRCPSSSPPPQSPTHMVATCGFWAPPEGGKVIAGIQLMADAALLGLPQLLLDRALARIRTWCARRVGPERTGRFPEIRRDSRYVDPTLTPASTGSRGDRWRNPREKVRSLRGAIWDAVLTPIPESERQLHSSDILSVINYYCLTGRLIG